MMSARFTTRNARVFLSALLVFVLTVCVVGTNAGPRNGATAAVPALRSVRYFPPTDAAIADGFRPPDDPYGPGNRGIAYATTPGDAILASAEGDVRFAGFVGPFASVTIAHDDGLVTTYSFLIETRVVAGDRVDTETEVGVASDGFHFGAKRGEVYLDPAILLDASRGQESRHAILVPTVPTPGP